MQKKNAQPLSEVLSAFFDSNKTLKKQFAAHRAEKGWYELLGEGVAKYTRSVYFRRGILHVQLNSSVLRAELLMNKQGLIDKINEYVGIEVVRDIVMR